MSCRAIVRESKIIDIIKGFDIFFVNNPNSYLVIVEYYALDEYLVEIKNYVNGIFSKKNIIFIKSLSSEELKKMYIACDLLISNRIIDGFLKPFLRLVNLEFQYYHPD